MSSQLDKATLRILICGGSAGERNRIGQRLTNHGYFGSHVYTDTVPQTLTMMRAGCFAITLCFSDVKEVARLVQTASAASTDEQLKGFPVIVVPHNLDELISDIERATPR